MDNKLLVTKGTIDQIIEKHKDLSEFDKRHVITLLINSNRLELRSLSRPLCSDGYKYLIKADRKIMNFVLTNYRFVPFDTKDAKYRYIIALRCLDENWMEEFDMCLQISAKIKFYTRIISHCVLMGYYVIAKKVYEILLEKGYLLNPILWAIARNVIENEDVDGFNFLLELNSDTFVGLDILYNNHSNPSYIDVAVKYIIITRNYTRFHELNRHISNDLVLLAVKKYDTELYQKLVATLGSDI